MTGLLGPELLYHGRQGQAGGHCPPEPNQTVQQGREQQGTRSPSQEAGLQGLAALYPPPDAALEGGTAGPFRPFPLEGSSSSSQECKRPGRGKPGTLPVAYTAHGPKASLKPQ